MATSSASTTPASENVRRVTSSSTNAIANAVDVTEIELQESAPSVPCEPLSSSTFPQSDELETRKPQDPKVGPHNFEKLRILGAGSTGRVYLVRSVGLGEEAYYAMKVVNKSELVKRNRVQRVLTERQILSVANHPFIVTLHYGFQTDEFFYFVMQYCAGGELFSFLRSQDNHRLSEPHARFYAAEVLIALEYLHLLGIIYRDLKPENILVHESGHVMLSDFDLAHEMKPSDEPMSRSSFHISASSHSPKKTKSKRPPPSISPTIGTTDPALWFRLREHHHLASHTTVAVSGAVSSPPPSSEPSPVKQATASTAMEPRSRRFSCPSICRSRTAYPHMDTESYMDNGVKRTSFVGTHEYIAPEIIAEDGYVGSVDWWAFGILLYEMVFAKTPFKGTTQIQTLENILDISEEIEFPVDVPASDECKDLIQQLLAKNVDNRLHNPLLIKSHAFFKGLVWPLIRHQPPPIIPAMVHSLHDKAYSTQEMSAFDDEVPYHKAAHSPPRRSAASSRNSTTSMRATGSGGTVQLAAMRLLASEIDSPTGLPCEGDQAEMATQEARTNAPKGTLSAHSQPQFTAKDADPKETRSMGPTTKLSTRTPSFVLQVDTRHAVTAPSASKSAPSSPTTRRTTAAVAAVHDFDYTSSQQRSSYWSSRDSHNSLSAKLSQMDMTAAAFDESRPAEYNDNEEDEEEEEDDDDEEEEDEHSVEMEEMVTLPLDALAPPGAPAIVPEQ